MRYRATTQALRQGWTVDRFVLVRGDGIQAPGAVTLCKVGGLHPWAVHFFNAQDGGFHSGSYHKDKEAALEAYIGRCARFLEPWDTDGDTSKWNENGEGSEAENDRYATRTFRE